MREMYFGPNCGLLLSGDGSGDGVLFDIIGRSTCDFFNQTATLQKLLLALMLYDYSIYPQSADDCGLFLILTLWNLIELFLMLPPSRIFNSLSSFSDFFFCFSFFFPSSSFFFQTLELL